MSKNTPRKSKEKNIKNARTSKNSSENNDQKKRQASRELNVFEVLWLIGLGAGLALGILTLISK